MSGRAGRASPRVQLPLLDRLIDHEPERAQDPQMSPGEAMARLRESVQRDLEALLNARRRFRSWPAALSALNTSPLAYGIPDCTAGSFDDLREREALRAEIEASIRRFEPRFMRVTVTLIDAERKTLGATLRLRIDAMLHADPAPEAVTFDTLVDAVTADVVVRAREQA